MLLILLCRLLGGVAVPFLRTQNACAPNERPSCPCIADGSFWFEHDVRRLGSCTGLSGGFLFFVTVKIRQKE